MPAMSASECIKKKFSSTGTPASIPMQRGGYFQAELKPNGVEVDNLADQPILPWRVFEETLNLLDQCGGSASRGDAMLSRLGDPGLPFESVEGHIAHVVYGKNKGDSVFRRITPVACILVWTGICSHKPGRLVLR